MVDADGYRPNVGIILSNGEGRLLWARRIGQDAWQFPQGGIQPGESPEQALFRELHEELGLEPRHVTLMGRTQGWLRYRLPRRYIRRPAPGQPVCIGQKQIWFLLRLESDDSAVRLNLTDHPEFDAWRWVSYWYPVRRVVAFKRRVYLLALRELAPLLNPAPAAAPRLSEG